MVPAFPCFRWGRGLWEGEGVHENFKVTKHTKTQTKTIATIHRITTSGSPETDSWKMPSHLSQRHPSPLPPLPPPLPIQNTHTKQKEKKYSLTVTIFYVVIPCMVFFWGKPKENPRWPGQHCKTVPPRCKNTHTNTQKHKSVTKTRMLCSPGLRPAQTRMHEHAKRPSQRSSKTDNPMILLIQKLIEK